MLDKLSPDLLCPGTECTATAEEHYQSWKEDQARRVRTKIYHLAYSVLGHP